MASALDLWVQLSCSNSGRVVHAYVPTSPSSIMPYCLKGDDAVQPGKSLWVCQKVLAAYCWFSDLSSL